MSTQAMILFPLCVNLPAFLGAFVTSKSIKTWYRKLNKPSLNPPDWIFGPVWTILYTLIGFSGYLI